MGWMKKTILKYMKELNAEAPVPEDDLEFRAKKLVEDLQRALSARLDFKNTEDVK